MFKHEDPNVVCLPTRDVAPAHITEALMTAHSRGKDKLTTFVKTRLCIQTTAFHDKLKLLKTPTLKTMYHVQNKQS